MIAGIAGGIATRLGRDVTVVRIVLVLAGLVSGFGVVAYVVAWLLLPVEGSTETIGARALSDRQGITIVLALVPALVVVLLVGVGTARQLRVVVGSAAFDQRGGTRAHLPQRRRRRAGLARQLCEGTAPARL